MAKFLKKFTTHSGYSTYINGQDAILPNVSYCVDNNDVHYNPYVPKTYLTAKLTTESNLETKCLTVNGENFSEILIDNVPYSGNSFSNVNFEFAEAGEHIIKFALLDNTKIDSNSFTQAPYNTNIKAKFSEVIIPDSVTTMGSNVFFQMPTTLIIRAETPPPLSGQLVSGYSSLSRIYVPAASVNTYKAASGWSTYASIIEPIPSA